MNPRFLIQTDTAWRLYERYAKHLPIIDFHNHLSVADIEGDRRFADLFEIWLESDPYKHRLMRICGVEEHYITGDASHYEKFEKFCAVFPYLVGNPVYDWAKMELSRVFGIDEFPSPETARYIYDRCGEMLRSPEFSNNAVLARFGIEYHSPVATLMSDIAPFGRAACAPSLRGDDLLAPSAELQAALQRETGVKISDTASYLRAVSVRLDAFAAAGCRFADHAIDHGFFASDTDGAKARMLTALGGEYAKRGFTLLLHVGAKRETSTRLRRLAGPAGGYAAAGEAFPLSALCDVLGEMERAGGLPDTILFPLNMSDQAPFAVLQGSFAEDRVASKVQLGPAWWWCDHRMGIENTLRAVASFGVLSRFIGMTTDSRSILSFVRHDYFRRLLCAFLDARNREDGWELPEEHLGKLIHNICYQNAKDKLNTKG